MVAAGDVPRLWDRHILDSLRALPCLGPNARDVADLGSGAGLPGLPVAIARPDLRVQLVERLRRRGAFLEAAVARLGLGNVRVVPHAVQEAGLRVDVCLARALARPEAAWELAVGSLVERGHLVYFAGRSWSAHGVRTSGSGRASEPVPGFSEEICSPGRFPWQGPVVIMRRSP
jgi:16S rRNA (guanine527-N7)-methyltransferase